MRVALPRKNEQEMRSFRFFLDVTAPSIAGVFDVDFWLTHIPQTCHIDIAIWHAIVGLGAVHENYLENPHDTAYKGPMETFALKQLNMAIGHLVRPANAVSVASEKWRALTVSIVFTYLCNLQGLYFQSGIHLAAANNLLEELHSAKVAQEHIDLDTTESMTPPVSGKTLQAKFGPTSIPYETLCSTIASLDINAKSLQSNAIHGAPAAFKDSVSYLGWKYYRAPSLPGGSTVCRHGKAIPSRATTMNLNHAGRAMRSLVNQIISSNRQTTHDQARLVLGKDYSLLGTLIHYQEPFANSFREISRAIDMFIKDTSSRCTCFHDTSLYVAPTSQQRRALAVLRLYHGVCYTMLLEKPHQVDLTFAMDDMENILDTGAAPKNRQDGYLQLDPNPELAPLANFSRLLDLTESVLKEENARIRANDSPNFTPILPTTIPLFIMAHIGWITIDLRLRIIGLLRQYPRRDLFMDSKFAAALIEFILNEEVKDTAAQAAAQQDMVDDVTSPVSIGSVDEAPLGNRICGASVDFKEGHAAMITLETWGHWLNQTPGHQQVLNW